MIWPLFHSTDADALSEPMLLTQARHPFNYNYQYGSDLDEDFKHYREFNDLGRKAIQQLEGEGVIDKDDSVWVHDYQCVGVPGKIYSTHIPMPSLSFLEQVTVNGASVLDSDYFRSYIKQMASYPTISFQRPVDMQNFIEVAAAIEDREPGKEGNFRRNNPGAYSGVKLKAYRIGQHTSLKFFGSTNPVNLVNIPVGIESEHELALAKASEQELKEQGTMRTMIDKRVLDRMKVPDELWVAGLSDRLRVLYGPTIPQETGETYLDEHQQVHKVERVPVTEVLGHLLNEDEEHRIFLSVHRNDYSKSTIEKMVAADDYLRTHSGEIGKTHFVFFLQDTRSDIPGHKRYQAGVEDYARELRGKYGDSVLVVPAGLDNQDFMGLLRHPNVVAYLGVGRKDGQDLMLREAASVRTDYPEGDLRKALAIITTNGTGASDSLSEPGKQGIFKVNSDGTSFHEMCAQITDVIAQVNELAKTDKGKATLVERYEVAAAASQRYNMAAFTNTIMNVGMREHARG